MSIFKQVQFSWDGEEYTVQADQVMGLIARIEEIITLQELTGKRGAPFAKTAMGYGEALRYAGAKVSNEEIYAAMFKGDKGKAIHAAVNGLLTMMLPPEEVAEKPKKKPNPRRKGSSS